MKISKNEAAVLGWFRGKALRNAQEAIRLLQCSEEQGSWIPRASRKVVAALSKANVAQDAAPRGAHDIYMMLQYGKVYVPAYLRARETLAADPQNAASIEIADRYVRDFADVTARVAKLDATRPAPVFTAIGVSPTLTKTLEGLGVVGALETIRVCPIEWVQEEQVDAKGKTIYVTVGYLKWPVNTKHHSSRFSRYNRQCEACGHAIKVRNNWVPLIIDDTNGTPRSVWVGKDCAKSLFGIEVKGELELAADESTTEGVRA